jgi:sugar lactone lactonase YvrE
MTIEILDASARSIIAPDTALECIADGFGFLEGPVWDRRTASLIFSDIPAQVIYRYTPGQGMSVLRSESRFANGNTIAPDGRLLTCEHTGRQVVRQEADGSVTPLATHYEGRRLNSPNDIVCRGDGTIFFTDPPYGLSAPHGLPAEQELPFCGLYRLDRTGALTLLADDFERPNGLAFSPDERLLYVADTARSHVRSFSVSDDGRLTRDRVLVELHGSGRGRPDGLKLDRLGRLYCTGPGGVWVIGRDTEIIARIQVPEQTANLAWGDADWQTLYLTASDKLYRLRLATTGIPSF